MEKPDLRRQLEDAEALVHQIKRKIVAGTCAEVGHDWRSVGGRNAGCDRDCGCSIPVRECVKCGDCDYGDNPEAESTMKRCAELNEGNG